jgi:serine protease Do
LGSGFVVDRAGYIITNHHVVEGADRIQVKFANDPNEYEAKVIGSDPPTDIAVIKVNAGHDLPAVNFGNSDEMQVGDWVLAIGSPFGLEQTVTAGIISTKERQTDPGASFRRFIQTDAAINPGNSGGPLVNMRGEVIGINSQIATSTGDYNGIGFALPTNIASSVYKQLMTTGKVRRGYLGVFLDSVKPEFARVYNLPAAKGAIIRDVADAKGPAASAGIQTNDVVVEFGGQSVENAQDLINKVASTPVGTSVPVIYLRENADKLERRATSVTVGERPPRRDGAADDSDTKRRGATIPAAPKTEETPPPVVSEDRIEGKIDRDLQDSFPASDPPGWVLGVKRTPAEEEEEADSSPSGATGDTGGG